MEKAMATHSSTLAWKIPWTEEPGGLQSMGWQRVRCNWVTSLSFFTFMHWRRKWQPTPVFLPGESQGRGNLVGYNPRSHKELDTTDRLTYTHTHTHPYMITGKTIALTGWIFVSKVMSLLFNMLSRFVMDFLPRSKHLLISFNLNL